MRYTEYLARTIDRLTVKAWEALLTQEHPDRRESNPQSSPCPGCGIKLNFVVEMRTSKIEAEETSIEMAAVTRADLIMA